MMLQVSAVKRFRNFSCQVDFALEHHRCGIFGPSGSGKSTLMHLIAGLLRPDEGTITFNGTVLFDHRSGRNLPPEQRRVGIVFQHACLFPHLSVKGNLFYGSRRLPRRERNLDPQELLAMLQLDSLLERRVDSLSGGERQRVALGRTILAQPRLILLDEPLSGLDGKLKFQIIPYLQKVFSRYSIPILFISHSLQEMRMMTEQVVVMEQGRNQPPVPTESLARTSLGNGGSGYTNLLSLGQPLDLGELVRYRWGVNELLLAKSADLAGGRFALNSRDILLFKKNPEATSARNMLPCLVRATYPTEWLVGVELECNGQTLISEIVPESLEELDIRPGSEVVAVFKASAFRRLY